MKKLLGDGNKYLGLLKSFLLLSLLILIIWNWNSLSWAFNYRVILDKISGLFQKEEAAQEQIRDNQGLEEVNESSLQYFNKENSIEIPVIGVKAPLIFAKSNEDKDLNTALKKGVLLYPGSSLPGQKGEVSVLGHNAPASWPNINYYKIFGRISELKEGDEILVYFNHYLYKYKMVEKVIVKEGEKIPPSSMTNSEFTLLLLTCWPPGSDRQRMVIRAEKVS